jgi:transmembrane sensor
MMKREKFLEMFSRKLSGEISAEDRRVFDRVIENNEEYKSLSIKFDRYFSHKESPQTNTDQLGHIWEMIKAADNENIEERFDYSTPKNNPFFNASLMKIAAMLILLISVGLLVNHLINKDHDLNLNKVVANDEKIFKMLDDGTGIWLNKKSIISYNKAFGKYKREITLDGEAYFDVAKNSKVPLFIHVGNIEIEVKGTAFNVNAYKSIPEVQIALIRGSIQVTDRLNDNNKVQLRPNEKLIYSKPQSGIRDDFRVLSMNSNLLSMDTKWVADTLVFHKEKLKDLVIKMERKYDLKIEIQGKQLKEKRFSGTFTNETIQQALEALKLSYPLTYTINNRLVVIND